ncbi:zeta-crystallin [Colletotrichum cereale]|nr:zeta-crystallin [Colletotrichum cereale]
MPSGHKSRAVVITEFVDDLNDIEVSEVDRPLPKLDEYLIQVKAAGVNFVDTLYAKGKHQNNRSLVRPPFVLGLEFSGVILSAPVHSHFRRGERVFGGCMGSYSEVISLPASAPLHRIPTDWTFAEAAGIAATLPVSYAALLRAGIKPGQSVLVHAAAGGLGLMAVQVATAIGCHVIGTAGSPEKCAVAEKAGARSCVNYTQEAAWWERVLELTGHKGADIVFDPVGLVDRSLKCIAHRGKILIVGFAGITDGMEHIAMNRILLKQASLVGYPIVYEMEYNGLEQVPRALKDMTDRKVWGKAVVILNGNATGASRARI